MTTWDVSRRIATGRGNGAASHCLGGAVEDRAEERGPQASPEGRAPSRVVRRGLGLGGTTAGLAFFCASLSPSLLPRSWILQGVVGGVAAILGYGLGCMVAVALRRLGLVPSGRARAVAWRLVITAGAVICASVLWFSADWQREVRATMGMDTRIAWFQPLIAILAAATFAVLLGVARSIRLGTRKLIGLLGRFIPPLVAQVAGVVVVVLLINVFANDVLFAGLVEVVNTTSSVANRATEPGVEPPRSPELSGGPGSLVPWGTLGRMGRDFVGRATTVAELKAFTGGEAVQPIRVYAGLESASSYREQARLAVRELRRTGGFQREVLALMGTTGTGWVDEKAAAALEYMYAGDTALVAMQYSYLPSWLSFLLDRSKAARASRALLDAVRAELARMREEERPRLLVFGESLGSYGMEAAFGGLDRMVVWTDGVLLAGPPNANPIWSELVTHRDPGTPMWRPVYRGGERVRFGQYPADLDGPPVDVAYLQNASDPVVWWRPDLVWRKPEWLQEPRGPDVAPAMRWYPVVTFWQVVVDLLFANDVPPGHGHRYGVNVADGWAAVAAPDGWTEADTARLRKVLAAIPA